MLFGIFPELYETFKPRPWICPGCTEPSSELICQACKSTLRPNQIPIPSTAEGVSTYFPILIAHSVPYRIMTHWKNNGGSELASFLFTASSELIREIQQFKPEVIVPIPQHEIRNLKRGHSSAFDTARFFSNILHIPIKPFIQLISHPNQKQASLNAFERLHSPNPFSLDLRFSIPERILIVDDFITTGNTLSHAAHSIRKFKSDVQLSAGCLGWKPINVPQDPKPRFFYSKSVESGLK